MTKSSTETTNRERNLKKIYSFFEGSKNPDAAMNNLIVDAIEIGIDYWCENWPEAKDKSEFYSERVWETVKAGCALEFGNDDKKGTLSLDSIAKGLNLIMKKYPRCYAEIKEGNYDAISADMFFQMSVFGKLIYG